MSEKPERVKGYKTKPDDDMRGHGWDKSVEFKYVSINEKGEVWLNVYEFHVDWMGKHKRCGSDEYLWLVPQRTGVYLCCLWCQQCTGPISRDDGEHLESKSKKITPEEAIEILKARGFGDNARELMAYRRLIKPRRRVRPIRTPLVK